LLSCLHKKDDHAESGEPKELNTLSHCVPYCNFRHGLAVGHFENVGNYPLPGISIQEIGEMPPASCF
jgi:hypothetical protein